MAQLQSHSAPPAEHIAPMLDQEEPRANRTKLISLRALLSPSLTQPKSPSLLLIGSYRAPHQATSLTLSRHVIERQMCPQSLVNGFVLARIVVAAPCSHKHAATKATVKLIHSLPKSNSNNISGPALRLVARLAMLQSNERVINYSDSLCHQ